MVIVSQDKELILNFENIDAIEIGNPLEYVDGMFKVFAITISDNEYTIGKYSTEKRAKEVLQEIILTYAGEAMVEYNGYILFEMPKEWDYVKDKRTELI